MKSSIIIPENFRKWLWLGYPLAVAVIILVTAQFVFGGSGRAFVQLTRQQQTLSEERQKLAIMNTKLAALQQQNKSVMGENLRWLDSAYPSRKQIPELVNQLKYAALESGAALVSYGGTVGNLGVQGEDEQPGFPLAIEYAIPEISTSQRLLEVLEKSFPVLRVSRLTVTPTEVSLEIVSAWQPLEVATPDPETPLPDYVTALNALRQELSAYTAPSLVAVTEGAPVVSDEPIQPVSDPFIPLPSSN